MSSTEFTRKSFDGTELHFQLWKQEINIRGAICLVHGLGEHGSRYSEWAQFLNQAGYAVITYDLRGHGRSGGQRGHVSSFEDYRKDTDLLLEEARKKYPGIPCFLYGHSLGGLIVTDYVLRRKPELNGVIVTALSNKTPLQEQKTKVLLSKILGTIFPRISISSGLDPSTICNDKAVVDAYNNDAMVHHLVTLGWGKNAIETIAWTEEHANEWSLPVLIMHGELDKLGYAQGSREFASKIKGDCTLKIWPEMAHEVHNEPGKAEVFAFLKVWLDKHLDR